MNETMKSKKTTRSRYLRRCTIEPLENRFMLSASAGVDVQDAQAITMGAVYIEGSFNEGSETGYDPDAYGDYMEISFVGGAEGTQLTQLVIDLDKNGSAAGPDPGEGFFDTNKTSVDGGYAGIDTQIVQSIDFLINHNGTISAGQARVVFNPSDPQKLTICDIEDFYSGDRLLLKFDVDEYGDRLLDGTFRNPSAVLEGDEFQYSTITGTFTAPHYQTVDLAGEFTDVYTVPTELSNQVSSDSLGKNLEVYTAGAFNSTDQTPLPASLSGYVYEDLDLSTSFNSGDKALGGVTLQLLAWDGSDYVPVTDGSGSGLIASTDADGYYEFLNLAPGNYRVVEMQPMGYNSVSSNPGTIDGTVMGTSDGMDALEGIVILGGQDSINNNFGEFLPNSISGYVYEDADVNETYDTSTEDAPLEGVTLYLYRLENGSYTGVAKADGTAWSETTDATGYYLFANLRPGTYQVSEIQPENYSSVSSNPGTINGVTTGASQDVDNLVGIALNGGANSINNNFGEYRPNTISGYVYEDTNVSSTLDTADIKLSNVKITLQQLVNGSYVDVAATQTNAVGYYEFTDLKPGTYKVLETQPNGYYSVSANAGYIDRSDTRAWSTVLNVDTIYQITVKSGESSIENNFGEYQPNGLSGHVYYDLNNNGVMESTETGIENVLVTVTNVKTNEVYTTRTNNAGQWKVEGLPPGEYLIVESQPEDYLDGKDAIGSLGGNVYNDRMDGVVVHSSEYGTDYDFGELKRSCIKGIVFIDENVNNAYDDGETLLENITVELLDSDGNVIRTTTTDVDGKYSFCRLDPGTYQVRETIPTEYIHGGEEPGTTGGKTTEGLIYDITVQPNGNSVSNNFWELLPGKISGYVFEDGEPLLVDEDGNHDDQYEVKDGIKKADSVPISGVKLGLYYADGYTEYTDAAGNHMTTYTDESGYYEFDHLPAGTYTVLEMAQPDGYEDCLDTPGSATAYAINPNDPDLDDVVVSVFAGNNHNFDAIGRITVRSGETAANNNFSEVRLESVPVDPPGGPDTPPPFQNFSGPSPKPGAGYIGPNNYNYYPATMARAISALYGGGGGLPTAAWHLSVINAGMPRRLGDNTVDVNYWHSPIFDPLKWEGNTNPELVWDAVDYRDGSVTFSGNFGTVTGIPLTGDFNGDGKDEMALFIDGVWFIDINGNGKWDSDDLWVQMGGQGDQPVVGDWDGDGKADIGVYGKLWTGDWNAFEHEPGLPDAENMLIGQYKNMPRPLEYRTSGSRYLKRTSEGDIREDAVDHVFYFGEDGDTAVTGDWNGDGVDNVGVFNNGSWYLDTDGNGRLSATDRFHAFGRNGDLPVTGDWNGDGVTNLGVYRNGKFILDTNGNGIIDDGDAAIELGQPGERPISGDFNSDGIDEVGTVKMTGSSAAVETVSKE